MALTLTCRAALSRRNLFLLMAVPMMGRGKTLQPQTPAPNHAVVTCGSPKYNPPHFQFFPGLAVGVGANGLLTVKT